MKKPVPDKEYSDRVKELTPNSPVLKNCLFAFIFGGLLCVFAEFLFELYNGYLADEKVARTCVSISVIVLTAIFTGLGIYDKVAKIAGAGFSVPISGFANSVCSPAIEFATDERDIIGLSRKAP